MPSKRLLKRGQFFDQHFEEDKADIIFKYLTKDVVTKQEIIQKMRFDKPNKNIYESIAKHKAEGDDMKKVLLVAGSRLVCAFPSFVAACMFRATSHLSRELNEAISY
jgi:hypothetical protein